MLYPSQTNMKYSIWLTMAFLAIITIAFSVQLVQGKVCPFLFIAVSFNLLIYPDDNSQVRGTAL